MKTIHGIRCAILGMSVGVTTTAVAELVDPPYFNLWPTNVVSGSGQSGHGTTVSLCGVSGCGAGSQAVFNQNNTAPAGTGVIQPFLRFQHNEGAATGSNTTEAAFNTDFRSSSNPTNTGTVEQDPNQFPNNYFNTHPGPVIDNQAKDANQWNHSLMLGSLQKTTVQGVDYFAFFLDINEPGGVKSTLRLDELAFFVADSPTMNYYTQDLDGTNSAGNKATGGLQETDANGNVLATATKVWDMDWNSVNGSNGTKLGNQTIGGLVLDSVNPFGGGNGSGDFDLEVLLPSALFVGFNDDDYVYLYNFAGDADRKDDLLDEAQAGFEEWAAFLKVSPPGGGGGVPEPSTALLVGSTFLGALGWRRKTRDRAQS